MLITKNIRIDVETDDDNTIVSCDSSSSNNATALFQLSDDVDSFALNQLRITSCSIAALKTGTTNASSIRSVSITGCSFSMFNVVNVSDVDVAVLLTIASSVLESVYIHESSVLTSTFHASNVADSTFGIVHVERYDGAKSNSTRLQIEVSDFNTVAMQISGSTIVFLLRMPADIESHVVLNDILVGGLESQLSLISYFRGDGAPFNATASSLPPLGSLLLDDVRVQHNTIESSYFDKSGLAVFFFSGQNSVTFKDCSFTDVTTTFFSFF